MKDMKLVLSGERELAVADPEGFQYLQHNYSTGGNISELVMNGNNVLVNGEPNFSDVTVVRNHTVIKSFRVNGFGLCFFALGFDKAFAVGRVDGLNQWKMGELDLANNRFVPLSDAPNILYGNAASGVIGNLFVVVGGRNVHFVKVAE